MRRRVVPGIGGAVDINPLAGPKDVSKKAAWVSKDNAFSEEAGLVGS